MGATALQIVYLSRRGARDIEHHDDAELEVLRAVVERRLAAGRCKTEEGSGSHEGRFEWFTPSAQLAKALEILRWRT